MSFDDVLDQKKRNEENNFGMTSRKLPWSRDVVKNFRKTDSSASPLLAWYHQEDAKRRKSLENELDITDIKNAHKGVKNTWLGVVSKYPEKIISMINADKFDWNELMKFKAELKNDG